MTDINGWKIFGKIWKKQYEGPSLAILLWIPYVMNEKNDENRERSPKKLPVI